MTSPTPDDYAVGLLDDRPDPLRYDYHTDDPEEAAGMIAAMIPWGSRVLDVGCGTGALSQFLIDTRGVVLVGIEPDPDRVSAARARGVQVHQSTFEGEWVESLGKFDVVVFADVLEHLPDPAAPLHLARTVLRPSGVVVASVPNVAHWSVRWDLLRGRFTYTSSGIMDATHLRWFTERSVRALFETSGYRIERLSHTLGTALALYSERRPWRNLPQYRVRKVLRFLTRVMPRVFGCQHVIRASPRALES